MGLRVIECLPAVVARDHLFVEANGRNGVGELAERAERSVAGMAIEDDRRRERKNQTGSARQNARAQPAPILAGPEGRRVVRGPERQLRIVLRKELLRVAGQLSDEPGVPFAEAKAHETI